MIIREGSAADADKLAQIEDSCFSRPLKAKDLLSAMESDRHQLLVAEEEGTPIALTVFYDFPPTAELLSVAVSPGFRRKGIGMEILKKTIGIAAERNNSEMLLEVRISNTGAIELYKKLGFRIIATRKDFYDLPTEDAYSMRIDLEDYRKK